MWFEQFVCPDNWVVGFIVNIIYPLGDKVAFKLFLNFRLDISIACSYCIGMPVRPL